MLHRNHLSLLAALGVAFHAPVAAQVVRDSQRLNTNGFNPNGNNRIDGAVIANRGTTFYSAWTEQLGTTEFTQDIYFARSTDDGASWSVPTRVDLGDAPNDADSDFPKMAVTDAGVVGVIWEEARDAFTVQSTNDDVFFNRSVDGGVTWQPVSIPLNQATAGTHVTSDIDRVWLAAAGETFHVTWEEDSLSALGGSEELWYIRSTDAGATWSAPVALNANPGSNDVDDPKVAADGNVVLITYVDAADDVIVHRSVNGGASWASPVVIESDPNGNSDSAQLALRGGVAAIAWLENDPGTVGARSAKVSLSNDAGATWRTEELLSVRQSNVAASVTDFISVVIQSATSAFVVYSEDSTEITAGGATGGSRRECLVAYTGNGGQSWTKDVELFPGVISNRPNVVATTEAVVVWMERNANGSNLGYFTHSLDRGLTWSAPVVVPGTGPDVDEGAPFDEGIPAVMSRVSNTVMVTHMDRPTGQNEVYASGFLLDINLGTNYCQAAVNSTGQTATMFAEGTRFVVDNDVQLSASRLPLNAFGYFLTSRTQGFVVRPGGSQGNLCLSGSIGRFVGPGQVKNSGAVGRIELQINLNAHPTPMGLIPVVAGDVWNFTAWYRDSLSGVATSNFADGLEVSFQ